MSNLGIRIVAATALAALCACQSDGGAPVAPEENLYEDRLQISNLAGMLQTAPDEFSVLTKRPLEMPNSFVALPTPEPGKVSTRDPNPQADARAALAFDPVPASLGTGAPSAAEAAILSSAGVADPSIRATLASEQARYAAEQDQYLLDRLFPRLREARGDADPDAIDAEAERRRLQEAGITPRPAGGIAAIPAATRPVPVAAQAPATRFDPGTGPVLVAPEPRSAPTLGVLAPEPAETTPTLIYLPEE